MGCLLFYVLKMWMFKRGLCLHVLQSNSKDNLKLSMYAGGHEKTNNSLITRTSKVEGWVGVCRGVSQLFNVDLMVVLQYGCTI